MGNNASSNWLNSKQAESRVRNHHRHCKLQPSSASEETLGGREELKERSRRASSSVATFSISNNSGYGRRGLGSKEKVPSKVSFKSVRSSKSKSIHRPMSAPQAEAPFDDTRSEDHVKSSKQNLQSHHSSSGSAHKFRYHFKKQRHNKQNDNNNNDCYAEEDSSPDPNEAKEEQVRPPSRRSSVKIVKSKTPSVVLRGVGRGSKTVVQDVDILNDRRIRVQVNLTSAAAGEDLEENEKFNNKNPQQREQLCRNDIKKRRDKGDSNPAESVSADEGLCESKEAMSFTEVPEYEAPPKDPTIASPLLHKINKDIKMMVVRKELLKTDPDFQKLYRANPQELTLTSLPASTNIADINRAFKLAVGIRLEVDNQSQSHRKSKVAKIIFDNENDATEAYVIGKQTKIKGKEVNFQI